MACAGCCCRNARCSTAKAALNRLVLTTDSSDPRYHRRIIYLQVKK